MSTRYLIVRVLDAAFVMLVMSFLIFVVVRILPADPALLMAGDFARPGDLEAIRARLGLDRPVYVQYLHWLGDVLHGNLGVSIRNQRPVVQVFLERLPATLQLTTSAIVFGLALGIPLGVLAAVKRNTWIDGIVRAGAVLANSTPNFFLGLMLILTFAVHLRLLPSFGYGSVKYFVLPTLTLSTFVIALSTRITRAALLEVLDADYIRTARSKGVRERRVIFRHALKNALNPVISVVALQLGTLVGGAIVTETVFAWPGIGTAIYQAIMQRDYPVVQATIIYVTMAVIFVNLLADFSYALIDPQVRYG